MGRVRRRTDQLGEGWYGMGKGYRSSAGHAAVFLAGPAKPGQKLYLHGRALDVELQAGPLHPDVTIDGHQQPRQTIDRSNSEFRFSYDLPPRLLGRPKIEVAFPSIASPGCPTTNASSASSSGSSSSDDRLRVLRQDVPHHLARDAGQPRVQALKLHGQTLVVDP